MCSLEDMDTSIAIVYGIRIDATSFGVWLIEKFPEMKEMYTKYKFADDHHAIIDFVSELEDNDFKEIDYDFMICSDPSCNDTIVVGIAVNAVIRVGADGDYPMNESTKSPHELYNKAIMFFDNLIDEYPLKIYVGGTMWG